MIPFWFVPYFGLLVAFGLAFIFVHYVCTKKPVRAVVSALMYVVVLFLVTPSLTPFTVDSPEPFKSYVEKMPQEYLVGLHKVYFTENGDSFVLRAYSATSGHKAAGAYNPALGTIIIDLGETAHDLPKFSRVAWHEVGHHVWYALLNNSQRNEFIAIHDTGVGFPTRYAKTSVDEDFAESFMAHHFGLMMSDDREQFMLHNLPNRAPMFLKVY
jgi:energy-coupling factor transporter transmembrane protein EcfT